MGYLLINILHSRLIHLTRDPWRYSNENCQLYFDELIFLWDVLTQPQSISSIRKNTKKIKTNFNIRIVFKQN